MEMRLKNQKGKRKFNLTVHEAKFTFSLHPSALDMQ